VDIEQKLKLFARSLAETHRTGDGYSDEEYVDLSAVLRRVSADIMRQIGDRLLQILRGEDP
jgi:hypothetical protein